MAEETLPPYLMFKESPMLKSVNTTHKRGVFSKIHLRAGLVFGPYLGLLAKELINDGDYAFNVRVSICSDC